MPTRHSGYARMARDTYVTPEWVYRALYEVEPWAAQAFDCAPVDASFDFLEPSYRPPSDLLATNPPFNLAVKFCRKALGWADKVAMLLPHGFDAAKGRLDLWEYPFKAKYTLTKRIRWTNLDQKEAGPSSNHAWYVWDRDYKGVPFMGWI